MAKMTPAWWFPRSGKPCKPPFRQTWKQQLKEIDAAGKKKKEALEADVKAGALPEADLKRQLKELRAEAKKKKEVLRASVENRTQKALSGAKRVLMYSQKGSDLVLRLGDGRKQTVDSKAARDGIVLWTEEPHAEANTLRLSSLRPWPLVGLKTTDGKTIPRIDPPISSTGRRRKMILRHDILYLSESGEWPAGWYRVTQATPKGLKSHTRRRDQQKSRRKAGPQRYAGGEGTDSWQTWLVEAAWLVEGQGVASGRFRKTRPKMREEGICEIRIEIGPKNRCLIKRLASGFLAYLRKHHNERIHLGLNQTVRTQFFGLSQKTSQ